MPTAIIINGVVRASEYASRTWNLHGDYRVFADAYNRSPRTQKINSKLDINKIPNKFSVPISSMELFDTIEYNGDCFRWSIVLNYMWKLKAAYNYIQNLGYQKVIVMRPDIFLTETACDAINNCAPEPDEIFYPSILNPGDARTHFLPSIDCDLISVMGMESFRTMSNCYDYVLEHAGYLSTRQHDVHTLLALYTKEKALQLSQVNALVSIVREPADELFLSGIPEYHIVEEHKLKRWREGYESPNNASDPIGISRSSGGILKRRR